MLDHHDDRDPGERTEELSRVELLALARSLNVSDADVMTRAELRAAIDKARRPEPRPRNQPVTWVSVARRLLASIVEQGLHLPDAAALIRGDTTLSEPPRAPPPVATVTLARIYAAQGHLARALGTLDEVLATDADHDMARELREQLRKQLEDEQNKSASQRPPERGKAREDESPRPAPDSAQPAASERTPLTNGEASPRHESAASGEVAPASVEVAPADIELAPASVEVPPRPEPAPVARSPRGPELLVIETGEAQIYVYWELPWPQSGATSQPHWIWIVAHTPTASGCDRDERCHPVTHESGALRVEGLPRGAIVRAKLTRDPVPSSRPLVVASSVRSGSLEARFTPHGRVNPKAVAQRALTRVDAAGAAYW